MPSTRDTHFRTKFGSRNSAPAIIGKKMLAWSVRSPNNLVVAASSMLAAELNAEFSVKLDHSETSGAYFTQGISSSSKQGVQGYLIFDTKTGRAVSPQGYIIVDTPPRDQVMHVAQYTARYIGFGG